MQIFKIDQWTATPQEKHHSDGCWLHENIILSFKCLNGNLTARARYKHGGKSLTLESLTGRFVLMKTFLSLRTVSFKNFSATRSKVTKLIFYVLNFVSWISCFLQNVPFSITVPASGQRYCQRIQHFAMVSIQHFTHQIYMILRLFIGFQ